MNTAKGRALAITDCQGVRKKARLQLSFGHTFGHNLEADFRKADNKRKRDGCVDIALGNAPHRALRPTMLGPSLKKRFSGSALINVGTRGVCKNVSS